jgi:hypothetical protein
MVNSLILQAMANHSVCMQNLRSCDEGEGLEIRERFQFQYSPRR